MLPVESSELVGFDPSSDRSFSTAVENRSHSEEDDTHWIINKKNESLPCAVMQKEKISREGRLVKTPQLIQPFILFLGMGQVTRKRGVSRCMKGFNCFLNRLWLLSSLPQIIARCLPSGVLFCFVCLFLGPLAKQPWTVASTHVLIFLQKHSTQRSYFICRSPLVTFPFQNNHDIK